MSVDIQICKYRAEGRILKRINEKKIGARNVGMEGNGGNKMMWENTKFRSIMGRMRNINHNKKEKNWIEHCLSNNSIDGLFRGDGKGIKEKMKEKTN